MYSSTLTSTSALDGMSGQGHAPTALSPGQTRYPLYRRLGGPQIQSGRVRKNLAPTGIRSPDRPARSASLYQLTYPGLLYANPSVHIQAAPPIPSSFSAQKKKSN